MGRDLSSSSSRSKRKEFQSTRPRGARLDLRQNDGTGSRFQSTRPRGARRARLTALLCSIQSFNPRAHVGRDRYSLLSALLSPVSIHAPTWGATPSLRIYGACRPGFNPRAHVGRDTPPPKSIFRSSLFQSTRPRGARRPFSLP